MQISLETLFREHKGKVSDKWSLYLRVYNQLFDEFRNQKINLLELGVQNGGSLEIWAKYFQNGETLVGCDINPECVELRYADQRINVVVGDANTDATEAEILSVCANFDIVLEDSSHFSSNTIRSFLRYFPHLSDGGLFVAEDLHCSYWQEYEGGLYYPYSAMAFFKRLADLVNYEHWGASKSRTQFLQNITTKYGDHLSEIDLESIHSVEFRNSLCIVRKASPPLNVLGKQAVAGIDDSISQGYKNFNLPTANQGQNRWSTLEVAPDEEWQSLTQQFQKQAQDIQTLNHELSERAQKIQNLELRGANQESQIRKLNSDVSDRNERMARFQLAITHRDTQIANLTETTEQLRHQNAELQWETTSLRNSTSWRSTLPLRWMAHQLKRVSHIVHIAPAAARASGGYFALLKKTQTFYRQEGLNGLRRGLALAQQSSTQTNELLAITADHPISVITETPDPFVRIDLTSDLSPEDDFLIFVAYAPTGVLTNLQISQVECYVAAGYKVALVVNSGESSLNIDPGPTSAHIQIVRQNHGFDFGAWKHALNLIGNVESVASLSFTNDSVFPVAGKTSLRQMRDAITNHRANVVFLTQNLEIKPHLQSYFFCLKRNALQHQALDTLLTVPYIADKDRLIREIEINLSDRLSAATSSVEHLYPLDASRRSGKNPTIHHWRELLNIGFPYFKIQLVTSGILDIDDPAIASELGEDNRELLRDHCAVRQQSTDSQIANVNVPPSKALRTKSLLDQNGAMQAYNPPPAQIASLTLPLVDAASIISSCPRILAIIHCYYMDVASEILQELSALHLPLRLLLTTDSSDKEEYLESALAQFSLKGTIVLCPNRGRDVAPFIIEGKKHLQDAELILHLHTKKSRHDADLANWGKYLRRNLIGSTLIVDSIIKLFGNETVGIVYSDHFSAVRDLRNWGHDYSLARDLMRRLGIEISVDAMLEFPTSTMFWARREALEPLLNLGLSYDDFSVERGQIDGTLAHAIERCILLIAEDQHFSAIKVVSESSNGKKAGEQSVRLRVQDVRYMLKRVTPRLLGSCGFASQFFNAVGEIYPVNVGAAFTSRARVNLILPTMKPEKIYGGITTALAVAKKVLQHADDDFDLRVIITSDTVNRASIDELSRRLGRTFILASPNENALNSATIVGLAEKRHMPLSLRPSDRFFATAWWTADLAFRLREQQLKIYGDSGRIVYLIQDYEPGFYSWSNKYALSEATYRHPDETIAIINSEELANYFADRYCFDQAFCIPYELNENIRALLRTTRKEKIVLAYGRPSVARNCFELIVEGVRIWQARNPDENCSYKVVFAGEAFNSHLLAELENAEVVGKLSLEEYAELLNRTAIGISLMVSPHPSYPPLEMASAGCIAITNSYEGKDISKRVDNIISAQRLSPTAISECLDIATQRVDLSGFTSPRTILEVESRLDTINYGRVAEALIHRDQT